MSGGAWPSPDYNFKVRVQGATGWFGAFVFVTTGESGAVTKGTTSDAYYWRLDGVIAI